jgi:hypothetical protein
MKQADLRDMFKEASKSVCTSTIVVSPDRLSPTPSTAAVIKIPGHTEDDPDDPEPADEGDIQMEYSFDSTSIGAVTKITCKNLGQYRCHLIIRNI